MKIVNFVKYNRKLLHLTQRELADFCGVSVATISSIESGRSLPRVDLGISLSSYLGVPVDELFVSQYDVSDFSSLDDDFVGGPYCFDDGPYSFDDVDYLAPPEF